jgi:hypothetical protein
LTTIQPWNRGSSPARELLDDFAGRTMYRSYDANMSAVHGPVACLEDDEETIDNVVILCTKFVQS